MVNDYLCKAESTAQDTVYKFCRAIIGKFASLYLRSPNEQDTTRILAHNEARGFRGMVGSNDCMHWAWKIAHLLGRGCTKDTLVRAA
jgi:hypothetical protein